MPSWKPRVLSISCTYVRACEKYDGAPSSSTAPATALEPDTADWSPSVSCPPKPRDRLGHRKPSVPPSTSSTHSVVAAAIERRISVRRDKPAGRPRRMSRRTSRVRVLGSCHAASFQLPIVFSPETLEGEPQPLPGQGEGVARA